MRHRNHLLARGLYLTIPAFLLAGISCAQNPQTAADRPRAFIDAYCVKCHNQKLHTAGLALDTVDFAKPADHAEILERVIAKLRAGSMPPQGMPRADAATYRTVATALENDLDRAWAAHPNPGRIGAVQRLNRTEYNNAIRDLLALNLDVKPLLPGDDTADGSFDNFADSLSISTAHLERYMSVARQVTLLATGLPPSKPALDRFEIPLHVLQDDRQSEDLPFGSRGGIAIPYNFPTDGEYLIKVRLQRQYQDYLKGMGWPQQLDIRLDGKLLKRFTVGGGAKGRPAASSYAGDGEPGFAGDPEWEDYMQVSGDAGVEVRIPVQAGSRIVGVSFVRQLWEPEGLPQPQQLGRVIANDQIYMGYANVGSVQIGGPYGSKAPAKDTASRRAIFACTPKAPSEERSCAATILARMARLAYRRPITRADTSTLLEFFDQGRADGGSFDHGIQFALERMLVDPDFLLRVYRDPANSKPANSKNAESRPLTDLELASRLSFFLWGSIPDDHLLTLAEQGKLANPQTLEQEVRRMLKDPRAADALVGDFTAQWLNLRQLTDVVVDPIRYPQYDESLLQAFQTETEMFVASTLREDRGLAELLNANYTFVNERLARHYGIANVYGSRFRRVVLPDPKRRGGLLAQGSVLVTTSYPDRTSPVVRGKWLLNNIFGLPIPPPPPGVNPLETKPGVVPPTMRERLAQHRKDPSCNSCHSVIDPLGFALENFDVIGGWRTIDESNHAVDPSGTTVGGAKIDGLAGLRSLLLSDPEQFPRTVTQKLMAFALGRRLEYYDQPAVRKIVRDAASNDYRWSSIVLGIVKSPAFLMRAPVTPSDKVAMLPSRALPSRASPIRDGYGAGSNVLFVTEPRPSGSGTQSQLFYALSTEGSVAKPRIAEHSLTEPRPEGAVKIRISTRDSHQRSTILTGAQTGSGTQSQLFYALSTEGSVAKPRIAEHSLTEPRPEGAVKIRISTRDSHQRSTILTGAQTGSGTQSQLFYALSTEGSVAKPRITEHSLTEPRPQGAVKIRISTRDSHRRSTILTGAQTGSGTQSQLFYALSTEGSVAKPRITEHSLTEPRPEGAVKIRISTRDSHQRSTILTGAQTGSGTQSQLFYALSTEGSVAKPRITEHSLTEPRPEGAVKIRISTRDSHQRNMTQ